jgi:hypothetical protein
MARLMIKCDYDYVPNQLRAMATSPHSSIGESSQSRLSNAAFLLSCIYGTPKDQPPRDEAISKQVLELVTADGDNISAILAAFFRTIDTWLPIIDPDETRRQIDALSRSHDLEVASLLLSIFVIIQMPDSNAEWPISTLYFQAKALQVALTSAGRSTIVLVKSALLIANYELGHGLSDAARITVSTCSLLAMKLVCEQATPLPGLEDTDLGRTVWGVIMLEK